MRFTFRSKKGVLKEKNTSLTDVNSQEGLNHLKAPPKSLLTLHDCKYAKFEPRSAKSCNEESMSQCDFRLLWNKTEAITKENRSSHVRLLSSYILNGPFCSQNKRNLNKLILKPNRRLKLKDEVMDDLTKCMYKQAKLLHKSILKEVAQHRTNSYHLAWKNVKSRCSNLSAGQVKRGKTCSSFIMEEKDKRFYKSNPEHCSLVTCGKSGHISGQNLPCVEQNNDTHSAGDKAFIHGPEEEHKLAKNKLDCHVSQTNVNTNSQCKNNILSTCTNKLDLLTESCTRSNSCEEVANGDTAQCAPRKMQPECSEHHTIKISHPKRFGMVNEAHCKVVSDLVADRLFCRHGDKVCLIIQENFSESYELVNLKLYLAKVCLDSFFFPCVDNVNVKIHRDLHQYLENYIFKTDQEIIDVFGIRHDIEDCTSNVDLLMLVPATYTGLFRHDDLCVLDSLSVILGYRKERLLVMKQSADDT